MKKILPWLLLATVILYTAYIFSYSMDNAAESTEKSGFVTELFQKICDALKLDKEVSEGVIRKIAHFAEFALLGVLSIVCADLFKLAGKTVYALFYSLSVSVIDEHIQLYSVGRASSVNDVMIDFAGALAGVFIVTLIWALSKKRKKAKNRK